MRNRPSGRGRIANIDWTLPQSRPTRTSGVTSARTSVYTTPSSRAGRRHAARSGDEIAASRSGSSARDITPSWLGTRRDRRGAAIARMRQGGWPSRRSRCAAAREVRGRSRVSAAWLRGAVRAARAARRHRRNDDDESLGGSAEVVIEEVGHPRARERGDGSVGNRRVEPRVGSAGTVSGTLSRWDTVRYLNVIITTPVAL